jgi:hypothetical protein
MKKSSTKKKNPHPRQDSSPVIPARGISAMTRLVLFVLAGGRCEFDGCNRFLLEHHVTLTAGNFAAIAHVVAFKPDGPRGRETSRPNINDIENLMLLCPTCHKLVDDHPTEYSRLTLEEYKSNHENRIHHVTGLAADQKTSLFCLLTPIGRQRVALPFDHILDAIAPRYPISRQGTKLDLNQLPSEGSALLEAAQDAIRRKVARLFEPGGEVEQTGHISLFALAPIPLLVFLGGELSNKVALDVYQRHRDTEDWKWKESGKSIEYEFRRLKTGTANSKVALLLSLSGTIKSDSLPQELAASASVYELTLKNVTPNPTFLRTRQDLENFRVAYQTALGTIMREHGIIRSLHLFPAVPAPIAVLCGRELLPKVHPELLVYDFNASDGEFKCQIKVNQHEN